MLTAAKLDMFVAFGGDVDLWQRRGMPGSDVMSGEDWGAISQLLQELAAHKRGLASAEYSQRMLERVKALAVDSKTAERLLEMA